MKFRKLTWVTKSKDKSVEVLVQVNRRGKETGRFRYKYANGSEKRGKYKPRSFTKKPWELSRAALLAGGFLVGFLLELLTRR
jgi:hypothetical protein